MTENISDEELERLQSARLATLNWRERLEYAGNAIRIAGAISIVLGFLMYAFSPLVPATTLSITATIDYHSEKLLSSNTRIDRLARELPSTDISSEIIRQSEMIAGEIRALHEYSNRLKKPTISSYGFMSSATAQTLNRPGVEDIRLYGVVIILLILGAAFLLCIGIVLFSNHARRLTFAIDTVKVLLGFFVGVASSFFGVR